MERNKVDEFSKNEEIDSTEEVIYFTYSVCPRCALLEKTGLEWKSARVIQRKGRVWLVVKCPKHGEHETLYCSNVDFFKRTLKFSYDGKKGDMMDIEDIKSKLNYTPYHDNLPLALELPLWENGDFVNNDELAKRIEYYKSLYPPNRQFVLKVLAKLAMDIPKLNNKVLYVQSLVPEGVVILEASYERLCLLCQETESVFLNSSIYPALKYFLRQGDEQQCKDELLTLFTYLKSFSGIQMMLTLCVNRPYPKLDELLQFIRTQTGFIRVCVISMERSPRELVDSLGKTLNTTGQYIEKKIESGRELNQAESADIYELLEHIQKSSHHSISVDDFFPASIGHMLEPFLNMMGYGFYFIRPSPFCGFITCLVNTEKAFTSYPVTRLFDFEKLFLELRPILPRLKDGKIGVMNATKIKKIFMGSQIPNKGPLPDLYSYLTDKSKAEDTKKFIQNLQFIVVHNNMDVAAMDLQRRCNCAVGTQSILSNGVASYCTGCI